MALDKDLSVLLAKAQQGDRESLDSLTARARDKVNVYLYRMTLDYHLAQDLTQDTVLMLMKSLKQLEPGSNASLWAWVYRSALGQLQHHQRMQGQRRVDRNTVVDHDKLTQLVDRSQDSAIIKAQRREMMEVVTQALNTLKLTYRSVLCLRCFDQLSYAEIAAVTGGTELQARLTFFRAKQALRRQLSRRGIKRDSLLCALTLFGSLSALRTQSATGATAVTSNLVTAGTGATVLGTITSPTGIVGAALLILGSSAGMWHSHVRGRADPTELISTSALLDQSNANMALPMRIIAAHDPDASGWQRLLPQDDGPVLREATDFATIVQKKWHYFYLAVPQGHWLDFGFDQGLVNGPGFDVTYHCLQSGGLAKVYLTDGRDRLYELGNPTVRSRLRWDYHVYFDLADADPPFQPAAIRIEGAGLPGSNTVFTLTNLRARN